MGAPPPHCSFQWLTRKCLSPLCSSGVCVVRSPSALRIYSPSGTQPRCRWIVSYGCHRVLWTPALRDRQANRGASILAGPPDPDQQEEKDCSYTMAAVMGSTWAPLGTSLPGCTWEETSALTLNWGTWDYQGTGPRGSEGVVRTLR